MPQYLVQLGDKRGQPFRAHADARQCSDMQNVLAGNGHYSFPRSSPANATTSRFRPIASSSKSTVTLVSFPTPVNS